MEILESFVWIAVGFVPMLCAMELAWRLDKKVRLKETTIKGVPPNADLADIMIRNVIKRILKR
jgi:hypothetical protein